MQIVTTSAIIAFLSLLVVFGLFSVVRDLLDRFVEAPLMSGNHAELGEELPAALPKTTFADTFEVSGEPTDN